MDESTLKPGDLIKSVIDGRHGVVVALEKDTNYRDGAGIDPCGVDLITIIWTGSMSKAYVIAKAYTHELIQNMESRKIVL